MMIRRRALVLPAGGTRILSVFVPLLIGAVAIAQAPPHRAKTEGGPAANPPAATNAAANPAKALVDAGVEVTMKTIHGAGHEGPQFRSPESRRMIKEFLSRNLKGAQ
jgi:hypothetical protein